MTTTRPQTGGRTLWLATGALAASTYAADRIQSVVGVRFEGEVLGVRSFSEPWGFPYVFLLVVILAAALIGIGFRSRPSHALLVALWGVLLGLFALAAVGVVQARLAGFGWAPSLAWILQPRFAVAPFAAGVAALMGAYSSPRRHTWS